MPWRKRSGCSSSFSSAGGGVVSLIVVLSSIVRDQSFVAKRFDRVETRRPPGWIEGRKQRQSKRHDHHGGGFLDIHVGGQLGEEIKLRREQICVGEPGQEAPDRIDVETDDGTEQE